MVGGNYQASITNSYSLATIDGTTLVGGLGGYMIGPISNSFFRGVVSGSSNQIGGLTGLSYGDITNSYVIGTIIGVGTVGGLVGDASGPLSIQNSYSESTLSGSSGVGGLIGTISNPPVTISSSTWKNNTDDADSCIGDGTNPAGCIAN